MAGSSNTTWLKGFSGNPEGLRRAELLLSRLADAIGDETCSTRPAQRTPWRSPGGGARPDAVDPGVIDGDMTAINCWPN